MALQTHTKSGFIALFGPPNAGKSSFLNHITGEILAGVSSKPQTTRKRQQAIYTQDSSQMIFVDLPGWHQSTKTLNQFMIQEIEDNLDHTDIVMFFLSSDQKIFPEFLKLCSQYQKSQKPHVLVLNKIDLKPQEKKLKPNDLERFFPQEKIFSISTYTGEGIIDLLDHLETQLQPGPFYYPEDQISNSQLREIAVELIRAQAMEHLHQEIPYDLTVDLFRFQETDSRAEIEANLVVAHDSQKGMVIGKGGSKIKQIGSLARQDLEKLIGKKIRLDLRVKVDKNWIKKPEKLAQYGYKKR